MTERRVVDAHVHIHPQMAPAMAELMDAAGIGSIINLGIVESLGLPFEESMRAYRNAFGARMVYFTTPNFRDVANGFGWRMADDLSRKVEAGARGLKIFKDLGLRHQDADGRLIAVDDPRLDPLWARAGELGVPVLIHSADPVAFFQPLENNERSDELAQHPDWHFYGPQFPSHAALMTQLEHIVARHPETRFIGAHVGSNAEDLTYVSACLERYPNYFVDTCARVGELGRHPVEEGRAFFLKHQDRVVFGSDLVLGWGDTAQAFSKEDMAGALRFYAGHWRYFEADDCQFEYPGYPVQGRWLIDGLGLPAEALEKLYFRNIERLVPDLLA
jgi:predicted TIM-barrel fold metal-dependent hydrolase